MVLALTASLPHEDCLRLHMHAVYNFICYPQFLGQQANLEWRARVALVHGSLHRNLSLCLRYSIPVYHHSPLRRLYIAIDEHSRIDFHRGGTIDRK